MRKVQTAAQYIDKRTRVDWLGDIPVASGGPGVIFIALHRIGRKRYDDHVLKRWLLAQTARQLQSIHPWKLDVHQNQLRAKGLQNRQSRLRIPGQAHLESRALQQEPSQLLIVDVIVHDKDWFMHVAPVCSPWRSGWFSDPEPGREGRCGSEQGRKAVRRRKCSPAPPCS